MAKTIDISKSQLIELEFISDKEALQKYGKGWSLSYTYSMEEIRDIFLSIDYLKSEKKNLTHADISNYVIEHVKPYGKEWTNRRVLENVNALINFGLIQKDFCTIDSRMKMLKKGEPLSNDGTAIFKDIFLNYYRFREMISLFYLPDRKEYTRDSNLMLSKANILFCFNSQIKFTDTFFMSLNDNIDLFKIPDKFSHIARFWDVFISWGKRLKIIEKFNLKDFGIVLSNGKNISCVYLINENNSSFDFENYILSLPKKQLFIPELIFNLVMENKFSIEFVKNKIIELFQKNTNKYSIERTSEIFLKNKEIIFYPIYKNNFVSHLLIKS